MTNPTPQTLHELRERVETLKKYKLENDGYWLHCVNCANNKHPRPWKQEAIWKEYPEYCPDCSKRVTRVERISDVSDYDHETASYNECLKDVLAILDNMEEETR